MLLAQDGLPTLEEVNANGLTQDSYHDRNPADFSLPSKRWPDHPQAKTWSTEVALSTVSFSSADNSDEPEPAPLIWGPEKDGLQAAIEYVVPLGTKLGDPKKAPGIPVKTGLSINFRVKNVSDRTITFVSETLRQGDYVNMTDAGGNEIEVNDVFSTGRPIDVRWKLKPGDVAKLGLLSPSVSTHQAPGKYNIQYTIRFNSRVSKDEHGNVTFPAPGDWQDELKTGVAPLFLRADTGDEGAESELQTGEFDHAADLGGVPDRSGKIQGKVIGFPDGAEDIKYSVTLDCEALEKEREGRQEGVPNMRSLGPRAPGVVISAGESFEFTGIPAGHCTLQAVAMRQARKQIVGKPVRIELRIQPRQLSIAGIAFNSAQKTTGWIESVKTERSANTEDATANTYPADTQDDGDKRPRSTVPGSASARPYSPAPDNKPRLDVRDPQNPEETKSLRGQVTDQAGNSVAGVRVALYTGDCFDRDQTLGQETLTDERGEYRFKKLKLWTKPSGQTGYFSQVRFEHAEYAPVDGKSVHSFERQSKGPSHFLDRLDMQMQLGGKLSATVASQQTGEPLANGKLTLANGRLRLRDGFLKGRRSDLADDYIAYLSTNESGKFTVLHAIPVGRYHLEIDRGESDHGPWANPNAGSRYPKIGVVQIEAGKTATAVFGTQELPDLQDPYIVEGVARGNDGELMIDGTLSPRADGGRTRLRFSSPQIQPDGTIKLQLGPVARELVSNSSPYGIQAVDFDFVGENGRQHYKLVGRIPAEPLVLTDDPTKPEVENGIRYLRPGKPATFEFIFARTDDVDNTAKTNSLVVKTVDEVGQPVQLVDVAIYDRVDPHGNMPLTFDADKGKTNLSGIATFPNSIAVRPQQKWVVVEVNDAYQSESTYQGNFVVLVQGQAQTNDPRAQVAKDKEGNVVVTLVMPREVHPMIQQAMVPRAQSPSPKVTLNVLQPDGQPAVNALVTQHVSPKRIAGIKVPIHSTTTKGQVEFIHDISFETMRYRVTHKTSSTVFDLSDYPQTALDDGQPQAVIEIALPAGN